MVILHTKVGFKNVIDNLILSSDLNSMRTKAADPVGGEKKDKLSVDIQCRAPAVHSPLLHFYLCQVAVVGQTIQMKKS